MIYQVIFVTALASLAAANLVPIHHAPQPYKFGYNVKDKHGDQYRQETGNGAGGVTGSYGFTDARGVKRQVKYVADHAGFRAEVDTNEPGTANQNPAAVKMVSVAPYAGGVAVNGMGLGLGYAGMAYGAPGYGYDMVAPAYGGYGYDGYGGYGLGYGGYGDYGLGYGGYGLGYGGYGLGYGGYGLGGLGYARYGY